MIDKERVEYIAKLAKININDQESEFLSSQLSKIIDYIDKLKEVDTKGIKPLRSLSTGQPLMREDKAKNNLAKDDILKNAPACLDSFFKIPRVIK
ncbi:MAG: Asp-tRNA(Asn)/Glu-tRNA(Gln) amidotransferase subunit GatC [Candidatus Omnitrophica bacterium]|nr:Asp-tRNA(Asn)/Glu-tRNA(Gln) amidotransferase subunit GatC [Candidatus Omnitrophota bacterium]MCF7894816.1 Asp-tRNA(Asn)/Glu-tRNA(Gln) amidotransferase subunit GatC [Candidatus Omnitrophota bacterium]